MRKMSLILFIIIFFGLLYKQSFFDKSTSIFYVKQDISPKDRDYLEYFFKYTIKFSSFGYVLYGSKPMSIDTYKYTAPKQPINWVDFILDYIQDGCLLNKYYLKKGWETWEKYHNRFPMNNFVLISYKAPWDPNNYMEFCLINRSNFIQTVNDHLDDFKAILGSEVTSESILENYLAQDSYFSLIRSHDGLFGSLLGYGRNNAWAFYNDDKNLLPFSEFSPLSQIWPSLFKALPGEETQILKEKYMRQREEIEYIYSDGKFLSRTLLKLSE
jgi:hypothetical protein